MGKFKFSSLFSSSSSADAEKKKQNRRSMPILSASTPNKDAVTNGAAKSVSASSVSNAEAAPEQSTSRMVALAQKIAKDTEKLETYMKENNLPMPSFDVDAPADFPTLPEDIQKSRQEIIHSTKELGLLAHGPREALRWGVWEVSVHSDCTSVSHTDSQASFWTFWHLLLSTTLNLVGFSS